MKKIRQIAIILFILFVNRGSAQEIKTISLKQQKAEYQPKMFHVVAVTDERKDTTNIGAINNKTIALQNGVAKAIYNYIAGNVTQDANTTPITISLSKIEVSKKTVGARIQVDLSTTLDYSQGDKKLIEFTGGGYQQTLADPVAIVEQLVRQNIEGSLKQFDEWWADHKAAATAPPAITITAGMGTSTDDNDHILYNFNRPLVMDDFQGSADDMSTASAQTNSAIGMGYSSLSKDNKTTITVSIIPYFNKSVSWMRPTGRNAYILAHEQLHFDITATKACELIKAINAGTFTPEYYAKEIDVIYKRIIKEGEQEQLLYDNETQHALVEAKQKEWESRIKAKLKELNCY